MPLVKQRANTFFSNSFFIFLFRFFPSLAGLAVIILYAHKLPVTAYGSYFNFWIQFNVFYPLVCFGVHALILTYPKNFILHLAGNIPTKYYLLFASWGVALSTVFAYIQFRSAAIPFVIPLLLMLTYSISVIVESFLIVCKSYVSLVVTNLFYAVAYVAVHWCVVDRQFSFLDIFYYITILNVLRMVVYAIDAIRNRGAGGGEQRQPVVQSPATIRNLWLHLGLYDVLQSLSGWVDKFIVSLVLTSSASALYFNGSMNIPFLPLLLGAASSAVLMQLATGQKHNEKEDTIVLMNQTGRVLSCIVFPLFFYLLLFRDLIVTLLTIKYLESVPIFILALFVLPVRAYSFTTVLQRLHKGALINAGAISEMLLAVLLMYPLYKWLGLPGIALGFVISTYFQAAFYLFHSARLLGVGMGQLLPFGNWLLKLIVFGVLFIGIHYILERCFAGKIALFLGGVVMGAIALFSLWIELKPGKYGDSTE